MSRNTVVHILIFLTGFGGSILFVRMVPGGKSSFNPSLVSTASANLSREERALKDCADLGGGLWVEDRDNDGLAPGLKNVNFTDNWVCIVSGTLKGHVHVSSVFQIGADRDDSDSNIH
ncbi:MAG: hypothetical protein AAB473_04620 [Patescibacteria group bacterium]